MSPSTVTASVLTAVHTLEKIQRELPPPGVGEIQVRVKSVGLCGSDLHYYHGMRNGDAVVQGPMTLGHEAAGIVEAVGPAAPDATPEHVFQVGDRVALELGTPCGTCNYCSRPGGRSYHLCPAMQFAASARKFPHCQGALQERINRPARWCFKIPDTFSYDLGALIEPLAVAVHAHRRGNLAAADYDINAQRNILILGAGPVGLLVAAVCRFAHLQRAGAARAKNLHIVILDLIQDRVEFAVANGFADAAVVLPRHLLGKTDADKEDDKAGRPPKFSNPHALSDLLVSQGRDGSSLFDVTFECTGQESSVQTGVFSTVPGGRIVIVGMGASAQLIPLGTAAAKEVDIVGVFRYANDYTEAIRLLREASPAQLANMEKIISHSFPGLDKANNAFERASKPYDEEGKLVLKVMIEP